MTKLFSNKKFAFALIGILLALQLTQSIANWCGGGFNGGSLVLCILILGLLTLVGVGIAKKNKLLTMVSGASILSVMIYVLANNYSVFIQRWADGGIPIHSLVGNIFAIIATFLLIGCFILIIFRAFNTIENLKTINMLFSVIASVFFLVQFIMPFTTSFIFEPQFDVYTKVFWFARDLFAMFIALLIPCVWHQVDTKD